MGIELSWESAQICLAFVAYLIGVAVLGYFSHRYLTRGSFVKEYFLGNRGLGPWVLALTIAATAISGGTFMGFPSLIYTNGWIMAVWIASYMVGPIATLALMGKRINQVSRIAGSVTVPDVLRDRFNSPILGITGSLLILIFLVVNLVAQFKGGANVMETALDLPSVAATPIQPVIDAKEQTLLVPFRLGPDNVEVVSVPLAHKDAVLLEGRFEVKDDVDHPGKKHLLVPYQAEGKTHQRRVNFPDQKITLPFASRPLTKGYVLGMLIFALTVIAYTTYGGYWAVTLTDVLLGLVMLTGVVTMAILAVQAVEPVTIEVAVPAAGEQVGRTELAPVTLHGLAAATERLRQQDESLVYGPGPKNYLPLGLAFSFFLMWTLVSAGQPSGMVRLMSFKDAASSRRALMLVCVYYVLTYMSLLVIFICARAIFPTEFLHESGSEARGEPDRIMPEMARYLGKNVFGGPLLSGLLLAAPYAAIMSTVAAFLLMISSSLVRDLYQRVINPNVSARALKFSSYLITGLVGVVVMFGAFNPPRFLQYIIVFAGAGLGCSFLVPMLLTLYWRRATKAGVLAAMLGGLLTLMALYVLGWLDAGSQNEMKKYHQEIRLAQEGKRADPPARPDRAAWLQEHLSWVPGWGEERHDALDCIYLGGVHALVWGLLASLILGVAVSRLGNPDEELVKKFFPE